MKMSARITAVHAGVVLALISSAVLADDDPTFRIEFKDGAISPLRLEVPTNRRIRLDLVNLGDMPAEFESLELRKERVVAPHSETVMVIRTLDPGQYPFFDDFHPGAAPAVLVAK
ncbi:cupredoxin domain-containing protein [Mesorhizobium sp. M4B.F.Ca.ET.049.02.1.2]|nr:cupredoxin domain-containing protein [Mesorhizobium sp. M4B.F.Ca.ET.049.02.1.2]